MYRYLVMLLSLAAWGINLSAAPQYFSLDQARQLEANGQVLEAAQMYEMLVKAGQGDLEILVRKLVTLYVALKDPERALFWVRQAQAHVPDPAAYEALILGQLGRYKEAAGLLRTEAEAENDPFRRSRLYNQLADLLAEAGLDGVDDARARAGQAAE